ncbi:MAG: aldehyde dehydrogenase [Elusimicrobiaceae bacterium]|nr:aldehyde dehydrogenase [Elusimicrobiaceae bacterium]
MNERDIGRIVGEVLKRLETAAEPGGSGGGVFKTVDEAVSAARAAQAVFQELGVEKRREIIKAIREAAAANAQKLARMAHEETGMGRYEDKVRKNIICAVKSPGVSDIVSQCYTGDKGLTLVEFAPFGVVAAVTPSTNPAATVINNSIIILAGGNAVVFAPHPAAKKTTAEAVRLINGAILSAGGPANVVATVEEPSQEATKALLSHPGTNLNLVTGGPAIVKVAMSTGKTCKVIAAGPGNPPVVVDETAVFPDCANHIVFGASFDNGVLCTAEKEVIVLESAKEKFLAALRANAGARELSREQFDRLTDIVIKKRAADGHEAVMNRDYVGHNAGFIAKAIGLDLPDSVRVLWSVVPNDHPLVWAEQLMPVLPVTIAPDLDAALELAYHAEGYNRHTAAMHSTNIASLTRMARRMQCSIFVKNAPTIYGLGMGEGYAGMSIGTPTGDGISKPTCFVRRLHCATVGHFRIT